MTPVLNMHMFLVAYNEQFFDSIIKICLSQQLDCWGFAFNQTELLTFI